MTTRSTAEKTRRLGLVIAGMREMAQDTEAALESALTLLQSGEEINALTLMGLVVDAYKSNADLLNILNLLDESGSEPALREVERKQANRRNKGARK